MSTQIISQVHKKVLALFDYVTDAKNYEVMDYWTCKAADVSLGKRFKGDCDDFSLTCAELLIKAGIPKSKVKVILCQVETGGYHLVCGVDTEYDTIILDNRFKEAYSWKIRTNYKWIKHMYFDRPKTWYSVK